MENLTIIPKLQSYIKETLGITINPIPWKNQSTLPFFLKEFYEFYIAYFLEKEIILMVEKEETKLVEGRTPAVIKKFIKTIFDDNNNTEVVFVTKTVASYNRKRFVQHQIPFIIPGNQMYLPMLGIDFREYFVDNNNNNINKSIKNDEVKKLSPSTQLFLLYIIIHNSKNKEIFKKNIYTPKEASIITGYSQMSMGRAFNELENAGIGDHKKEGKERKLILNNNDFSNKNNKKRFWKKILPYLQSPIKRKFLIRTEDKNNHFLINSNPPSSSLSALSGYTMIAEPTNLTYAISQNDWKQIKEKSTEKIKELKFAEPGAVEIEIWTYNPKLLMKQEDSYNPTAVDKFSLYLTLKDNADERIQGELKEMMEKFKW